MQHNQHGEQILHRLDVVKRRPIQGEDPPRWEIERPPRRTNVDMAG
jgi:hypothetical protein